MLDMTPRKAADDGIEDFTIPYKEIKFKIAPDIFEAYEDLPILTLMEFSQRSTQLAELGDDDEAAIQEMTATFELVLKPDSFRRFVERMRDREKPIGIRHVNKVIPWLLEQYGLRPTQPSSGSSNGSPSQDGGTNLTVVALPQAPTSGSFP